MRRSTAIGAVAIVVLVAGYVWHSQGASRIDLPISEAARKIDLEMTVTATGKIQPHAYVDVGAQASGQLKRILVNIGDTVKQGDLLAEIDPQVQAAKVDADGAQLSQFTANLVEQEANVEYAQAMLDRYSKLALGDSISQMQFEESRRDARAAAAKADSIRAQIRQMGSTLEADRVALGYTKIYAPMSGTVVSIDAREGQTLNAAYSTPQIMRIADLKTMTVWTQVSEADVTRLKNGMPVYFTTLGNGDRRWTATLRQILPAPQKPASAQNADPNTAPVSSSNVVLYTALFDINNDAGDLRPEMTAQAFFVTGSAKDATVVPVTGLHSKAGADGSFAVTILAPTGVELERDVEVGLRTRFLAQIIAGVEPGEQVVTGRKPANGGKSLIGFGL
ncbi:MAG TPA: efflux RND transporter periplasmic adaptor subunit [Rhizobium sp.]